MTAPIHPDEVARVIVLTRGKMDDGGSYWCYVSVKPSRHKEFQESVAREYNIQNFADDGFGEVIVSGRGDNAPDDVTRQVAELFGVPVENFFTDTNPEATLTAKLAQTQASE
jgi:hypothetical protein